MGPQADNRVTPMRSSSPFSLLLFLAPALAGLVPALGATPAAEARDRVEQLGRLTSAPAWREADGVARDGVRRAIYFDGLPWQGRPTRVFAWLGVPERSVGPVPGMVLVHGGGGTAFREWVQLWNDRGFAAISIAVEGQTDERVPGAPAGAAWRRHDAGGPARHGIYADFSEPLEDQFMYHAVADTVLAHSLLRTWPGVDPAKIGLSGISWGGVITSTVIGIDGRFAWAIPIYGCGHLFDADNQWGRALGGNAFYREVWDPMIRLGWARMPVLWLSWPGDLHFPLDCQAESYRAAAGPRQVALIPGMKHSHPAGWNPPDSVAFAESIVTTGRPWGAQIEATRAGGRVRVRFASTKPLEGAVLVATTGVGFTGNRTWTQTPAELQRQGDAWDVSAALPEGTTAWFINARSGGLTLSSDYQEIR